MEWATTLWSKAEQKLMARRMPQFTSADRLFLCGTLAGITTTTEYYQSDLALETCKKKFITLTFFYYICFALVVPLAEGSTFDDASQSSSVQGICFLRFRHTHIFLNRAPYP